MSNSLKATDGETLFLELAHRGYHLSRLKNDDQTAAEIVTIEQKRAARIVHTISSQNT